jgi:hypothetical protein
MLVHQQARGGHFDILFGATRHRLDQELDTIARLESETAFVSQLFG